MIAPDAIVSMTRTKLDLVPNPDLRAWPAAQATAISPCRRANQICSRRNLCSSAKKKKKTFFFFFLFFFLFFFPATAVFGMDWRDRRSQLYLPERACDSRSRTCERMPADARRGHADLGSAG